MRRFSILLIIALGTPGLAATQATDTSARAGIEAFNRAFDRATRNMDNAATMALWEDDGVSLLPSTQPIVGKKAIAQMMDAVVAQFPGARMEKFESTYFDINVSGDLASEWCTEHQIVHLGAGKPPFDGRGKMLLVLHRGPDGKWRLRQEMWNQAVAPDSSSKTRPIQAGVNARQDSTQIERLAMHVVHGELTNRGVTDWTTIGLDPDLDAGLKPLHPKRESAHVQELLAELGGRQFSTDSVGPNSFHCRLNSLTKLIYLSAPSVMDDSATVRILYNLKDQHSECRFFTESKTLSFARRAGAWVYTGFQGGVAAS